MTYSGQAFASPQEALAHYGTKGMRWGVRKQEGTSEEQSAARKARAKKVAVGVGVLAVAAGAAYVGYQLHKNGHLSLGQAKAATSASAKKVAENIAQEPTKIVHATRGRNVGFKFFKAGGLPDAMREYERAGFTKGDIGREFFSRYGDSAEKVAARFFDPEGRKDFAGRLIPHEVIVPKSMAGDIHSLDDVKSKLWPLLKDDYADIYTTKPTPRS